MLPICLRHAPNNLTEDEHPVHLVFLDRVPRWVAFVIRDDQQLILHHLQALYMGCVVVQKRIDTITVERFNSDINEQQITGSIVPDMLSPRTLMMRIFSAFLPSNMWRASSNEYSTERRTSTNSRLMTPGPALTSISRTSILKYLEWLTVDCIGCTVLSDIFPMPEDNHSARTPKAFAISTILVVWLAFPVSIFWIAAG